MTEAPSPRTPEDVRRALAEQIGSGRLRPGQRLGAERALAAEFGVSRATLRQALAVLEEGGVVRRVPGRGGGTFVAKGKIERDLSRIVGVPALLRSQGVVAGTRVLSARLAEADDLAAQYEATHDDYQAIIVKALADRLAEAFAEHLHEVARRDWYETGPRLTPEDLAAEKFRGIRPAFGYPACPDHSEKATLFDLLGAPEVGIQLTESFAMTPPASVSGLYFGHPEARYFTLGKIGRDQVEDYARRKGMAVPEVERWLRPNLAYEPAAAPD